MRQSHINMENSRKLIDILSRNDWNICKQHFVIKLKTSKSSDCELCEGHGTEYNMQTFMQSI